MSRGAERGFTLLEVVVALTIIGVTSVAALAAIGAELRSAVRGREMLAAAALADERLAVLKLLSVEELRVLPDSLARGAYDAPFDGYEWRASSRLVVGEEDLYELHVLVEWDSGSFGLTGRVYRPVVGAGS